MTEEKAAPVPASNLHPDVLELAQKITDKVDDLVMGVETLDANNWLSKADEIDVLNSQLQALLVEAPKKTTPAKSSEKA